MSEIATVASWLREARSIAVMTGAGISAESGVPTFRGADGLWRSFRPEELATPEAFQQNPALVWEWYGWRRERIAGAEPNPGHHVLARLESRKPDFLLLTQNVDGLHRRAGSRQLVELHGNIWRARCTRDATHIFDERRQPPAEAHGGGAPCASNNAASLLPSCPSCGALVRPDVVWFGEALDRAVMQQAMTAIERCEVLLLVGTSGVVYPVAGLPSIARRHGARVVEINVEATPLSELADQVFRGPAGTVLPALEAAL